MKARPARDCTVCVRCVVRGEMPRVCVRAFCVCACVRVCVCGARCGAARAHVCMCGARARMCACVVRARVLCARGTARGGRTPSTPWFPQPRAHAACGNQAGRGLRRPRPESMDAQRSGAHWPPDTLSVAWLRGTFGRGAQASSAGFLHHMDWLEHVYTKVGPSGVPPPRARALSRECYAYHIRLFLGRLGDHFKDSLVSLSYPFPKS